jgi:hypothetical protein
MRKIAPSGWILAAIATVAITLHLTLTQWGSQVTVVHCDGRIQMTKGPSGAALITSVASIADAIGIMGGSCNARAIDTIDGLFARRDVPYGVALSGGVIFPIVLFGFVIYSLNKVLKPRVGTKRAVAQMLFGVVFLIPPFSDALYFRSWVWQDTTCAALGVVFLAGGIFFWRSRPKRQET